MSVPDLHFLRTFAIVAAEGGFTRAGERLRLTQPAVSYQMGRLEAQLGVELFERAGRRLILTSAGRRLRDFADRYLAELDGLAASLSEGAAPTEPLRIAAVSGFGRYVLFPVLSREEFSGLRLHLSYPTLDDVYERVAEGEVDLGFVYHVRASNYLEFEQVYREEAILIASAGRAPLPKDGLSLEELEALPFVTYVESDWVFGTWFESSYGRQPRRLKVVHHFEELEEVVDMVRLNRGVSIVPDHSVAAGIQAGGVVRLEPTANRCINRLHAVTRAGAYLRPEVAEILAALRDRSRQQHPPQTT